MKRSEWPADVDRPAWLLTGAQLVTSERSDGGARGYACLGRRRLARLCWTGEGRVFSEVQLDTKGRHHGLEVERDRHDGTPTWCTQWVHGVQHGLTMQFDRRGVPVVATEFVRGFGADIWMSSCGRGRFEVSEVQHCLNAAPHGLTRWGDPQRPWSEEFFRDGEPHGIFRQWANGVLDGGPRFFVAGAEVSRKQYEQARRADASLPAYDAREDDPRRPPLPVVVEALARAKQLRRELALLAKVERMATKPVTARRSSTSGRR